MPPNSAQGYGRNPKVRNPLSIMSRTDAYNMQCFKSQQTVNLPPLSSRGHTDGTYYDSSSHSRARSSSLTGPHSGYLGSDGRHGGSSSMNRTGERTLPGAAPVCCH